MQVGSRNDTASGPAFFVLFSEDSCSAPHQPAIGSRRGQQAARLGDPARLGRDERRGCGADDAAVEEAARRKGSHRGGWCSVSDDAQSPNGPRCRRRMPHGAAKRAGAPRGICGAAGLEFRGAMPRTHSNPATFRQDRISACFRCWVPRQFIERSSPADRVRERHSSKWSRGRDRLYTWSEGYRLRFCDGLLDRNDPFLHQPDRFVRRRRLQPQKGKAALGAVAPKERL